MELITLQSELWQSLLSQLQVIREAVCEASKPDYDDFWLNEPETCEYLGLSPRTLFRMRKGGEIAYAKLHGKYFYTIGEITRILNNRKTGTHADYLQELSQRAKTLISKGQQLKSKKNNT